MLSQNVICFIIFPFFPVQVCPRQKDLSLPRSLHNVNAKSDTTCAIPCEWMNCCPSRNRSSTRLLTNSYFHTPACVQVKQIRYTVFISEWGFFLDHAACLYLLPVFTVQLFLQFCTHCSEGFSGIQWCCCGLQPARLTLSFLA